MRCARPRVELASFAAQNLVAAEHSPEGQRLVAAQYQSAQLMAEKGVNVPLGIPAFTVEEVRL